MTGHGTTGSAPRRSFRSASRPGTGARLALLSTAALCAVLAGPPSQAHEHADSPAAAVDFAVSCTKDAAAAFNGAVTLLHHMTYPQARQAFEHTLVLDPRCAMAHWGVAMTLFQPLWPTRPSPAALQRGWEAVQVARALDPPTERERLFIAAAEAFFVEPASTDYWQRIRRWEAAMANLHAAFPGDPEAATFYALAHLAAAPPTTLSRAHADRAASILMAVHASHPDHPGVMHYLVHANDTPGRETEGLDITRTYESAAPDNPHALHMPTHIYTRLGDWTGVIRANLRAAEAALRYPAGEGGAFVWDEFPHAIEYLVYAYLQEGADGDAAAQVDRLRGTPRLEPSFKTAFHLASTRARHALERQAWDEAAAIEPPDVQGIDWNRYTWPEAIMRFAQGLGAAHLGRIDAAKAATARLAALETATGKSGEELFARNIRMLRLELEGWLAHAEGKPQVAVALMRDAADLEASTPKHAVTPGPTLPAHELLGDLLMAQQAPGPALDAYGRSVASYPKRFNSLLGAARAARMLGDSPVAGACYGELLAVAGAGTRGPALAEARDFLASDGPTDAACAMRPSPAAR